MSIVTELFNSRLYFFRHEWVQSILGVSIARLQLRYKFSLLLAAWWSIEHLIHYEWIRNIPVYYELLDPSIKRKEVSLSFDETYPLHTSGFDWEFFTTSMLPYSFSSFYRSFFSSVYSYTRCYCI